MKLTKEGNEVTTDFWNEDYFLHPDFEDMYNYVAENPEKTLLFSPTFEEKFGDELFYQLCLSGDLPYDQYARWEEELRQVFAELITKDKIIAFASPRGGICKSRKLTGLNMRQLIQSKNFCGKRQYITTLKKASKLLLCTTRGLSSTCALALNWNILFLMQDLHGCILLDENYDKDGLNIVLEIFHNHCFIVEYANHTVSKQYR